MPQEPLSFEEWLQIGVQAGYCSEPVCDTHEGVPLTEAERTQFDEGYDPCIPSLRLWIES